MTRIGSKWVCSNKVNSDGTLDQYKARLVTQVFKQEYGINYEETFVCCQNDHCTNCIVAVKKINKYMAPLADDVKNTFLHGDFHQTIYMRPSPGYSCPRNMVSLV